MASAIISKLRTENFEAWKSVYDQNEPVRRKHGVRSVTVARDASEPNLLTLVTRFDSVDAAKRMLASDDWKDAVKNAKTPILEAFFVDIADERSY